MIALDELEDFILFLFLHLASVDGAMHPNERDTILEKMEELFPGSSFQSKLSDLEIQYQKLGFVRAEAALTEAWPRFSSMDPGQKTRLYPLLFEIINSDARVNEEETRLLKVLKGWLTP